MKNSNSVSAWPQVETRLPAPVVVRMAGAIAYTGLSRSSIYIAMRAGELQPVKLTSKAIGFTLDELEAFVNRRIAATPRTVTPVRIDPPEVEAGIHPSTR